MSFSLFVTKSSTVPIVNQIASQIVVAIASGELRPGARLPSIRRLAGNLTVHPNTIRAAYSRIEAQGWIEVRPGSGAYVSRRDTSRNLAALAHHFASAARALGADDDAIRRALEQTLLSRPPTNVVIVEPEEGLRQILVAEVSGSVPLTVTGAASYSEEVARQGSVIAALAARTADSHLLSGDAPSVVLLQVNSAIDLLRQHTPPARDVLVTFASHSPALLRIAYAVLASAGWDPEALVMQDARKPGWKRSLRSSQIIIADAITIREVPPELKPWHLKIIAENSLRDLAVRCRIAPECHTSGTVPYRPS